MMVVNTQDQRVLAEHDREIIRELIYLDHAPLRNVGGWANCLQRRSGIKSANAEADIGERLVNVLRVGAATFENVGATAAKQYREFLIGSLELVGRARANLTRICAAQVPAVGWHITQPAGAPASAIGISALLIDITRIEIVPAGRIHVSANTVLILAERRREGAFWKRSVEVISIGSCVAIERLSWIYRKADFTNATARSLSDRAKFSARKRKCALIDNRVNRRVARVSG